MKLFVYPISWNSTLFMHGFWFNSVTTWVGFPGDNVERCEETNIEEEPIGLLLCRLKPILSAFSGLVSVFIDAEFLGYNGTSVVVVKVVGKVKVLGVDDPRRVVGEWNDDVRNDDDNDDGDVKDVLRIKLSPNNFDFRRHLWRRLTRSLWRRLSSKLPRTRPPLKRVSWWGEESCVEVEKVGTLRWEDEARVGCVVEIVARPMVSAALKEALFTAEVWFTRFSTSEELAFLAVKIWCEMEVFGESVVQEFFTLESSVGKDSTPTRGDRKERHAVTTTTTKLTPKRKDRAVGNEFRRGRGRRIWRVEKAHCGLEQTRIETYDSLVRLLVCSHRSRCAHLFTHLLLHSHLSSWECEWLETGTSDCSEPQWKGKVK